MIVVAAGSGRRFGGPKQFLELAGRSVVDWSVESARSVADGVVVVVPADHDAASAGSPRIDADRVVTGGDTRAASVRAGLRVVPDDVDIVVVHDAVRPLARSGLFESVVAAVREGADGAVPALPIGDTVKRVRDGAVVGTVERNDLVVVQTPQAFSARTLRRAHEGEPDATDDAALVERLGGCVRIVDGDPRNLKITHPGDLGRLEAVASDPGRSDA